MEDRKKWIDNPAYTAEQVHQLAVQQSMYVFDGEPEPLRRKRVICAWQEAAQHWHLAGETVRALRCSLVALNMSHPLHYEAPVQAMSVYFERMLGPDHAEKARWPGSLEK